MWAFPHCTKATRKTRKLDGLYLRIVVNCTKAVLAGDTAAVSRFRAEDLAFADERLFAAATRPAEDGFRAELIEDTRVEASTYPEKQFVRDSVDPSCVVPVRRAPGRVVPPLVRLIPAAPKSLAVGSLRSV